MSASDNLTASEHTTPTSEHTGPQANLLHHHHHHPIANPYTLHQPSHHYQSRQQLHQWLRQAQTQASTPPATETNTAHPTTHQPPILKQKEKDNDIWGDPILHPIPPNRLRIMAKNINTINIDNDYIQWQALAQATIDTQANIICIQETNLQWNSRITHRIGQIFRTTPLKIIKLAVSQSEETSLYNYQPGGTLTAALGTWASRIKFHGADPIYGRWSYLEMEGKADQRFIFITGYRTGSQQPKLGANTCYDQQYRLLQKYGYLNPDPPNQFIEDLIAQIQVWRTQGKAVLLCIDANEDVVKMTKKKGIGRLSAETDLVDLLQYRHPDCPRPATHNRGSKTIDACYGSPEFLPALRGTTLLPFGIPEILSGDHRTVIVEFDSDILFGITNTTIRPTYVRGVNSQAQPTVTKFCRVALKAHDRLKISARISELESKHNLNQNERELMDAIDYDLTQCLTTADQKCRQYSTNPWSPKLHRTYMEHRFWNVQLTVYRTERPHAQALQNLRKNLTPEATTLLPDETVSIRLRKSRHKLRLIRKEAETKRREFLNTLLQAAKHTNNKQRQKLILGLKQAEENRRCFRVVKNFLKPTNGGVTHVLVPNPTDPNKWDTVHDITQMEQHLLNQSRKHFS